jgi:endonuclease/exonuclease/phosphatase family metal-dependent hydrolase
MKLMICGKKYPGNTIRSVLAALVLAVASFFGQGGQSLATDDSVRVMTRNVYQGVNFDDLLDSTSQLELLVAAGNAYTSIHNSKPAERLAAIAREIVRNRVDLVGLQEMVILRTGPSQLTSPFTPATNVEVDFMQLLLKELQRLGARYHVVAIVPGLDAQLPTLLGFDARLTVNDAIIARSHSSVALSNVQVQGFLVDRNFSALGGAVLIANPRGWASVDVQVGGRKFRFATTHLETPDFPAQPLQAFDMIEGAGDTALPVVFVGDFNAFVGDPLGTYQRFITAGFVDAWTRKRPSDPGPTCCQAPDLMNNVSTLNERIDLVLFRGSFLVEDIRRVGEKLSDRTVSGRWPSDHAGVVATLRIPRH